MTIGTPNADSDTVKTGGVSARLFSLVTITKSTISHCLDYIFGRKVPADFFEDLLLQQEAKRSSQS